MTRCGLTFLLALLMAAKKAEPILIAAAPGTR
jgi:hypothetical protein